MTVRERMLALRLAEKIEKDPSYAHKIGVTAVVRTTGANRKEDKNA